MPDYLLEIGTEELPADHVHDALERLKGLMTEALQTACVKFGNITTLGTPRRLTCVVHGIAAVQDTVQKKVAGPAVKGGFNADGTPTQAATKFAEKHGLTVEQLTREAVGGVEKLIANLTIEGKPVGEVLKEIVPGCILQLSGERPMRWGSSDLKFSRPIRWMVSLLDSEEVPVALDAIKSGRDSYGNRVLAPDAVRIDSSSSYNETLRKVRVLANPSDRQKLIEEQVGKVAAGVKGKARQLDGPLLAEVVNLTEWPHAVLGEFEHEYLDLPDKLIETIMVHHQRYFPIERTDAGDSKKRLLPYFITIANNDRQEAQAKIKQGNERVIRARLADGRFFYFDDQKTKLASRTTELVRLTFQEGLGSYTNKIERLVHASNILIDSMGLDSRISICLERAIGLCKLDLVSNLVRELPELQGYVGSWYSEIEGEPPDVVTAIASHYAPRSQHDTIPQDTVGQFVALIDKLDNIVGLFAIGRRPSGSSDPYALRRQAQGVVDILFDGLNGFQVNVNALIELFLTLLHPWLEKRKGFEAAKTVESVRDFLLQRVRGRLTEKGYKREIIDAVMAACDPLEDLPDAIIRCDVLQQILGTTSGVDTIRAAVRIGNILSPQSPGSVDPKLFENDAEKQLWDVFQNKVVTNWEKNGHFVKPTTTQQYLDMMRLLESIVGPVTVFFEKTMVNDPDPVKKNNRHGMLKAIYQYFAILADFPKLQPLLP